MIANYEEHGFVVTAKRMPESCTACPFWWVDMKTLETGGCTITGTQIILDGRQDIRRMDDCPIYETTNDLGKIKTCDLVAELSKREGVETHTAEPYEDVTVFVNGPAAVLVVMIKDRG